MFLVYALISSKIVAGGPWYVNDASTTGDLFGGLAAGSAGGTGSKASPFLRLNDAITAASSGDSIYVEVGNYGKRYDASTTDYNMTATKDLVIQGANMTSVIFDDKHSGTTGHSFMIIKANVTLNDFSIFDYGDDNSSNGQAITVIKNTTNPNVVIHDIQLFNNGSDGGHAPIYITSNSTVNINGGGMSCNGNNSWPASGGVDIIGSNITVTISNYLFANNEKVGSSAATNSGSALYINGGTTVTTSVNSTYFYNNQLSQDGGIGGSIYVNGGAKLYLTDCNVSNSSITNSFSNESGTGVAIIGSSVRFERSIFQGNQYNVSPSYGGAIFISGASNVNLDSCYFNTNKSNNGSDIYTTGTTSTVNINYCVMTSTLTPNIYQASSNSITSAYSYTPAPVSSPASAVNYTCATCNKNASTYTANPTTVTYTGTCSGTNSYTGSIIVLPIELTKFQGQCINNQTTLVWQTASETNNKVFNIERSIDGIHFSTIGSVNGSGTSMHNVNYTFIDKSAETSAYYRLSQVDYNGNSSRSDIIYVERNCAAKTVSDIFVFPNPTNMQVSLGVTLFQSSEVLIEVYNDIGQLVLSCSPQFLEAGIQTISIDNSNSLVPGLYFVKVSVNNQATTHKLIKL